MANTETQALTQNENGQQQVVVVPTSQPQNPYYGHAQAHGNVKYVYAQPQQAGAGGTQVVYVQPTDSQVARNINPRRKK